MGKKPKWLGAVKKVFSPESKDEKLRRRFAATATGSAPHPPDLTPSVSLEANASALPPVHTHDFEEEDFELTPPAAPVPVAAVTEDVQRRHEPEQRERAAPATEQQALLVAAPEAAVVAGSRPPSEEIAATKIQTAFRGYLARRALRALKGLVRLKSLVEGHSVKRQATSTLRCMQTLSRVQSKIRTRRIKMSEENQALQRQLLLNQELESLRMGDQWNTSLQSKEQIEAGLVSKQEAAARRERALAYAFSHQWKSSSRSSNPMFVDPNNPHWGWSWVERWMAARPAGEGRNGTTEKESNTDRMSVNSTSLNPSEGEITKVDSRMESNPDMPSAATPKPSHPAAAASRQSPSTPSSSKASPALARKKSATPKNGSCVPGGDDDAKSVFSVQSERPRRHSIGVSSTRDGTSPSGSSPSSVPSYMAATKSARAKTRLQSPVAEESPVETLEKGWSVGSAKKRLSFPAGTAPPSPSPMRRHSGPPKVPQVSATAESNKE